MSNGLQHCYKYKQSLTPLCTELILYRVYSEKENVLILRYLPLVSVPILPQPKLYVYFFYKRFKNVNIVTSINCVQCKFRMKRGAERVCTHSTLIILWQRYVYA